VTPEETSRTSSNDEIALAAIRAYAAADRDEGTFDIIASNLLEPEILTRDKRADFRSSLCRVLSDWTCEGKKPAHRGKAALLAMRVLRGALAG